MDTFAECLKILRSESFYRNNAKAGMRVFPDIDCPSEYKEAICALYGADGLGEFMKEALGALDGRSLEEVLKAGDYPALEEWVRACVRLDVVGPGA